LFVLDPEVGYRFVNSERRFARRSRRRAHLERWCVAHDLRPATLPASTFRSERAWAAPVVGVRGVANVTRRFFVAGKFDIGGAGIGADLTTQLYGVQDTASRSMSLSSADIAGCRSTTTMKKVFCSTRR
jgi:hypothetical protein